jgi:hypothetical protein
MSCGLCWDVPPELDAAFRRGEISRAALTERICEALGRAERSPSVDCGPIDALLARLREGGGLRHTFVTTNWDGLLDRRLRRHGFEPPLHVNGSIAERNLLTEGDDERAREAVPQAREALRRLMDADLVVVAGLSLSSRLDKGLVSRLAGKRGGRWLVVNHDAGEVRQACEAVRLRLPQCTVSAVEQPFDDWVEAGMPGIEIARERTA